ncbi:MAG: zinc ribbon domain-containing protein, partial [Chloroflexota bacterium]|nr:zinc ribbon domain-containing protein [Chloroflexota bacterium]
TTGPTASVAGPAGDIPVMAGDDVSGEGSGTLTDGVEGTKTGAGARGTGRGGAATAWLNRLPNALPGRGPGGLAGPLLALALTVATVALLAGQAGVALVVGATAVPVAIVMRLRRIDVFEREPVRVWWAVGAGGFVVGLVVAIVDAWLVERFWFSGSPFHAGAVGLAGDAADGEGAAPSTVVALVGVVIPALALVAAMAAPIALRKLAAFRNEVVDGVVLGAAAMAGVATATATVHLWPLVTGGSVAGVSVADGTALALALSVVRRVALVGIGGLAGAAIWRHAMSRKPMDLVIPLVVALGATQLLGLISVVLMPTGMVAELVAMTAVAVGVALAGGREARRAVAFDRARLGLGQGRVVCPNCHRVTPAGAFCASCGKGLGGRPPSGVEVGSDGQSGVSTESVGAVGVPATE